jgi:LPS export ABC transporter protein LptC
MPLFLLLAVGCGQENTTPVASPELLETGADQVFMNLSTFVTVDGIREGRVEADTAYLYQDSSLYVFHNMSLVLYRAETGTERARVIAERGRMKIESQELVARENVVLTIRNESEPGGAVTTRRVETAELHYDPNGDRIWSDTTTVMYEEGTVTRGQSFESDLQFRRAEVINGSIIHTDRGSSPAPSPAAADTSGSARTTPRGADTSGTGGPGPSVPDTSGVEEPASALPDTSGVGPSSKVRDLGAGKGISPP